MSDWWRRLGPARPRPLDLLLAVGLAIAVAFTIAISQPSDPSMRAPNAFAYTLAAMFGVLVLFRRRWPVGVLMASFFLLQIYYWSNFPSIWPAVPLSVALYSAAEAGHLRWAIGVVVWYWVVPFVFALVGFLGPFDQVLNDLVRDGSLMIAVVLFGDASRSHQALMADAEAQLRRVEEERERESRELSAARVIQQQLLPKELPALPGWRVAAYYQPARAIGGDFYDFVTLPDGQIAFVTGDVTDKGIPAALVMATTHSILRAGGDGLEPVSPGEMLKRANDRLFPDIPPHMFVTCLYAVLDPATGRLRFANAGHNLPYLATGGGISQLRATGMPLGALPDMTYEENEAFLAPGDSILFHSDGLVEAHNPAGEMFGFPRLQRIVAGSGGGERLIDECLMALSAFVGPAWEQEDDITLVTLGRQRGIEHLPAASDGGGSSVWRTLAEFAIPSERGNERRAMEEVAAVVIAHGLSWSGLERMKTAVAEATMNAMEHGNHYQPEVPVRIRVATTADRLLVRITDAGTGPERPRPEMPDLAAKLSSQQSPRGWGLFLIERMVDEMRTERGEDHYTVELVFRLDEPPEGTGE